MGRWHAHACERSGGQVAAIVDVDEQAARRLAAGHAGALAARSLEDVPINAGVNLLHICAPLAVHEAEVLRGLARGCPVIVEKPVARSADAVERLIEAARARGLWVAPVHQLVFQRGVIEAQAWTRSAGPVRAFDYRACSAGAERGDARPEEVAADILPHPLSLLDVLLPGGLEQVDGWQVRQSEGGELAATAVTGPTSIRILISMHGRPPRHDMTLIADRGTLSVDLFHGFAWREWSGGSRLHKLGRPFAAAAAVTSRAAFNLARRAAGREWAYPGLTALVARVYGSLAEPASRPLGDRHLLAVARARDAILAGREGC